MAQRSKINSASIPESIKKRLSGQVKQQRMLNFTNIIIIFAVLSIWMILLFQVTSSDISPFLGTPDIEIHGKIFEEGGWDPVTIKLEVGKDYIIRVHSDDVAHGLEIPELGIDTGSIARGEYKDIEVHFYSPGTFEFQCSILCSPDHGKMIGTFVVS